MERGKRKGKTKVDKPLAERKRRARINDALLQLKSIVLQSIKNESTMMSKLEKADILEMTVEYIHRLQHLQTKSPADVHLTSGADVLVLNGTQYTSGFNECASHVAECISALPNTDVSNDNIKTRLLKHIASVASSSDFRDKSQEEDTEVGERSVYVEDNAVTTGEANNHVYTNVFPVSQNSLCQTSEPLDEQTLETNNLPPVNETSSTEYLKPLREAPNSLCNENATNATYTNLENVPYNTYNYQYPMYSALYNGVFNFQGDFNSGQLPNEENVLNPTFILLPAEVPNVQGFGNGAYTALNGGNSNVETNIHTTYNVSGSEEFNASKTEIPYTNESGILPIASTENDSKTLHQTQGSQVQISENDDEVNQNTKVCTGTEYEQSVHASVSDIGSSDNVSNIENAGNAAVTVKDSSIMNIPKKRRVLGDVTNIGTSNRINNNKSPTETSLGCERRLKPHSKSPRKSKKKSPLTESKRVPKPFKKRIAASIFERENETCNQGIENAEAKQVTSCTDNLGIVQSDISDVEGRHELCMLNSSSSRISGERSNNLGQLDGSNIRYYQDNLSAQNGCAAQENVNIMFPQNGNKLPSINTFHELLSGKYQNRHYSPDPAREHAPPLFDHSMNDEFYQHYFAQNSSGNVWRPW